MSDIFDRTWKVGNYGIGARHWYVWRQGLTYYDINGEPRYPGQETADDSRGNPRRFASPASAQKLADALNKESSHV